MSGDDGVNNGGRAFLKWIDSNKSISAECQLANARADAFAECADIVYHYGGDSCIIEAIERAAKQET